jgi:hypothetical protein
VKYNLDSFVGLPVEVAVKYDDRLDEYGDPYKMSTSTAGWPSSQAGRLRRAGRHVRLLSRGRWRRHGFGPVLA